MKSGFPGSSAGKEYTCKAGDPGSPGTGRSLWEGIGYLLQSSWAFLVAQSVKNPPAMMETWVWSLGREDPLDWEMATHSSILAWRIPVDRAAWWATVHGVAEWDTMERLSTAHARNQLLSQWPKRISATQGPHETCHSAAYATHLVFEDMWVLIYKISVTFCSYFVLWQRKENTTLDLQIKIFKEDIC